MVPFEMTLVEHLRVEAARLTRRGVVTRGQALVVSGLMLAAVQHIEELSAHIAGSVE